MPRNQEAVTCPPGVWTELTNSDATAITFQVLAGAVKVRVTAGATPPALAAAGYPYYARAADRSSNSGEMRVTIATFTTSAGANRVYAQPINGRPAVVIVDHA